MIKYNWTLLLLLAGLMVVNAAYAGCAKTLMGSDCVESQGDTSSHMRGNAVANAKAFKALEAVRSNAKKKAVCMTESHKNDS